MKYKPNNWPKEIWIFIFIVLLASYFMTINSLPDNVTGAFSVMQDNCRWDYATDEFSVKGVLRLDLKDCFSGYNMEFALLSDDGKLFLKDDVLTFFPEKKENVVTIIAKNKEFSCSKTIKIINV